AVVLEVDSAAASRAAVARRAVAGHPGAGDGVHEGGPRGRFRCNPRGGETNFWANRLCCRSFVLGLCSYPDSLVERAGAVYALAIDLFHAMERPAHLPRSAGHLHYSRPGIVMDAVTPDAGAARGTARPSASCGARAIRRARDQSHAQSQRHIDLCVTSGTL